MAKVTSDKEIAALLVIDRYNDFISEEGKIWDRVKGVGEANSRIPNMLQVLNAARKAELRVFHALHHRYRQSDYETRKYGNRRNPGDSRNIHIGVGAAGFGRSRVKGEARVRSEHFGGGAAGLEPVAAIPDLV
jgi:hypothetical protein